MWRLPPSYRIGDLIDGKVDAIAAYSTNEADYLNRAGFPYYQFTPRTAGIDFYGDNLFTSEYELRRHPERVKAFRAASYQGFLYRSVPGADLGWLYLSLAVSAAFHFSNLARERRRTEETIRQGELRFRTMFEEAPMGIALIDTVSGQFLDIKPRYLAIAGRSLEHMKRSSWMEISHPDDLAGEQAHVAQLLARRMPGFRHAKRIVRPDGDVVWVDASVTAIATACYGGPHHLCMLEDVTDKRQTEALIWQQANFDTLTQLPNRRMFHERLRETDTVARLGGDEFTVILSDLDGLLAPFLLGQEQAFVSASIGITLYPDDAGTIEDLLKHADQAMYVSKGAGRNRYSYFTPAMQVAAVNRMRLGADLRTALREQQMQLYYQPIVELHGCTIVKVEALLRWHHPQRGVVCPPDFLALAESSGLPGLQLCLNQSPLAIDAFDALLHARRPLHP